MQSSTTEMHVEDDISSESEMSKIWWEQKIDSALALALQAQNDEFCPKKMD